MSRCWRAAAVREYHDCLSYGSASPLHRWYLPAPRIAPTTVLSTLLLQLAWRPPTAMFTVPSPPRRNPSPSWSVVTATVVIAWCSPSLTQLLRHSPIWTCPDVGCRIRNEIETSGQSNLAKVRIATFTLHVLSPMANAVVCRWRWPDEQYTQCASGNTLRQAGKCSTSRVSF